MVHHSPASHQPLHIISPACLYCQTQCLPSTFRWVRNKAANFNASELASTLASLAVLRYRNPWLLRHLARVIVSPKLQRLDAMSGEELATVAAALAQLEWPCEWLVAAVGDEAAARLQRQQQHHQRRRQGSNGLGSGSSRGGNGSGGGDSDDDSKTLSAAAEAIRAARVVQGRDVLALASSFHALQLSHDALREAVERALALGDDEEEKERSDLAQAAKILAALATASDTS